MGKRLGLAFCTCAAVGACAPIPEEAPTLPRSLEASLIPDAPTATPTPVPDVVSLPAAPGGGVGGTSGSCGVPTPPSVSRVNVGLLNAQPSRRILNATPLVGPDGDYCRLIGYTDGRLFCPVRPEGHPEREACEALRVGRATDTGRTGPTWTAGGRPCLGRTGGASCANHPDNQFLVIAYGTGTFEACTLGGTCGQHVVP